MRLWSFGGEECRSIGRAIGCCFCKHVLYFMSLGLIYAIIESSRLCTVFREPQGCIINSQSPTN